MSDNIKPVDFDPKRNEPHFNWFALCLLCIHRWIATVPASVSLFALECPKCKRQNSFCAPITDEYTEAIKEINAEGLYADKGK